MFPTAGKSILDGKSILRPNGGGDKKSVSTHIAHHDVSQGPFTLGVEREQMTRQVRELEGKQLTNALILARIQLC